MDIQKSIERDMEREPLLAVMNPWPAIECGIRRPPVRLFDLPPPPRQIRAGQFWAIVREHQWPAMPRWFSYVVYDDATRTATDEHSGMVAVVWPGGSSYAAAACAAGNEVARLHYERQRSMLAAVGAP